MAVAVLGADLTYGHSLCTYFQQQECPVIPVSLSSILSSDNPMSSLANVLASKGITTFIDASYDEYYAVCIDRQSSERAAISSAVLSHCQRTGLNYVLVSYHSVFSKNTRPVDPEGRLTGFTSDVPPVIGCQSIAVDCLQTAEYALLQSTSTVNPAARRLASRDFRGYLLRLGPLVYPRSMADNATQWTLTPYLSLLRRGDIYICPSMDAELTPISSVFANRAIFELANNTRKFPQGIYHLASRDSVSVGRLHRYVTQRFGVECSLIDLSKRVGGGKVNELVGFVDDTPLVCDRWQEACGTELAELPSWQQMIDDNAGGRTLHPVLIN